MPPYGTQVIPTALYPGDQALMIGTLPQFTSPLSLAVGETSGAAGSAATTGNYSERFVLAGPYNYPNQGSLSVELYFSVNPGAFNFQIQEADTDDNNHYVTLAAGGTITTAVVSPDGTHYIARLDVTSLKGRSVRLYCSAQPANACTVIGKISR